MLVIWNFDKLTIKKRLKILVTAGPTREPIDPVRFISNYSTGFLGYEIAKEAKRKGHRVILISGPTALAKPKNVRAIDVHTASQMKARIEDEFACCDCLIMSAAIGDFRPKTALNRKIKRARRKIILELRQNPDILAGLGRKKGSKMLVGFALESENLKKNAQDKLRHKNLDLIVATQIKTNSYPFGPVRLDALIMGRNGYYQHLRRVTKRYLSRILLDSIEKIVLS